MRFWGVVECVDVRWVRGGRRLHVRKGGEVRACVFFLSILVKVLDVAKRNEQIKSLQKKKKLEINETSRPA